MFFSPQLILQFTKGVQWFYNRENYPFLRIQRGSNFFQGVQIFPGGGGPNAYFYRNPYNLWFSRRGGGCGHEIPGQDIGEPQKVKTKKLYSRLKYSKHDSNGIAPLEKDGQTVLTKVGKAKKWPVSVSV